MSRYCSIESPERFGEIRANQADGFEMTVLTDLEKRVRQLKTETVALYLAARHPDTPWSAKIFVAGVAAYAFSPIDLIPDFIPVVGYLDDLILIPLGIAIAIKLVPAPVLAECRASAALRSDKPVSRAAAAVVVMIWLALAAFFVVWAVEAFAL